MVILLINSGLIKLDKESDGFVIITIICIYYTRVILSHLQTILKLFLSDSQTDSQVILTDSWVILE